MTEQQRTTRIEFVKKLLVANGFVEFEDRNPHAIAFKKDGIFKHKVFFQDIYLSISRRAFCCDKELIVPNYIIYYNKSLTPLRDFIRLSNKL